MNSDIRFIINRLITNSETWKELEKCLNRFSVDEINAYWLRDFIQNPTNSSDDFESDIHRIILISFANRNTIPYGYR